MRACGYTIKVSGELIRKAALDADQFLPLQNPDAVVQALCTSRERIDLFTFLQKPPHITPQFPFAMEWDNLAVLPISSYEHWWKDDIHPNVRVKVRKALKNGVSVREVPFDDALVRGIVGIYNETPVRQGRAFCHYGISFDEARAYAGTYPEDSIFVGAFIEDQLIGFGKMIADPERTQACIIHLLSLMQHKDKAPTNALVSGLVKACADRGIPYLTYGRYVYGKKLEDSLTQFKQANGFRRMDLPRYYIPLTKLGSLSVRFGWHRRLVDRVPEAMLVKVRNLRNAWHNRRLQLSN